jgi:hypothetical protein
MGHRRLKVQKAHAINLSQNAYWLPGKQDSLHLPESQPRQARHVIDGSEGQELKWCLGLCLVVFGRT